MLTNYITPLRMRHSTNNNNKMNFPEETDENTKAVIELKATLDTNGAKNEALAKNTFLVSGGL